MLHIHLSRAYRYRCFTIFLWFFLVAWLGSCKPVRLVQASDDVTERRLVSMQEKFCRFFIRMERQWDRPEGNLSRYADFYEDLRTDVDVLRTRSRAMVKTDIVQQQLDLLGSQIDELETIHKAGFHSATEIGVLKSAMEETMVSMFKFQFTQKNRWR
jgi:hypothetical protein